MTEETVVETNEEVSDTSQEVETSQEEGSSNIDATEGDTSVEQEEIGPIPYDRFKSVVEERNSLRGVTENLSKQVEEIRKSMEQSKPEQLSQKTIDDIVQERAKAGNPLTYTELFSLYEQRRQEQQEAEKKRLDTELDKQIKSLYSKGIITSKAEENAVLDFALKKGEELGVNAVPLSVAAQWYKETKPKNVEGKEVSKKIQSSKNSDGPPKGSKVNLKKDLDEIIYEAKANAPK